MTRFGRRAIVVLVAAAVLGGCGGGNGTESGNGYHFSLPAHWHKRSTVPTGVQAVYERDDHTALVSVRSEPRRIVISHRFIRSLGAQLRRQFRGYVPVAHRIVVTKAGPAFLFSFAQKAGGRLTSILLVPAHGKSYVLDAVSNPRSKAATRDVASIFKTFVPGS